jgi:hypothetical protein
VLIKLLLDADGEAIDNPTIQVQPIFNQGTVEQFFKWNKIMLYIIQGKLQSLRGTDKAIWKCEMDIAGPILATAAGISAAAAEKLWYAVIMKLSRLIMYVLKEPPVGFKHRYYMERHVFMGKQTGVRDFMDRIDILSTNLPLFPPISNEIMSKLMDVETAEILYNTVPHYYVKNMKEANKTPILQSILKNHQLILERMLRSIPRTATKMQIPRPRFLESRGWERQT